MSAMEPNWDDVNEEEEYEGPDLVEEGDEYDVELEVEELEEMDAEDAHEGPATLQGTSMEDILQGFLDLQNLATTPHVAPGTRLTAFQTQIATLLNAYNSRRPASQQLQAIDDDEDDDDEDDYSSAFPSRTRQTRNQYDEVKEPQQVGLELLMSGEFGRVGNKVRSRAGRQNLAKIIRGRAASTRQMPKEDLAASLVPNSHGTAVASYQDNIYCGQFSADSSFYYTCSKDFRLHIYDMTAPLLQRTAANFRQRMSQDSESGYRHETTMKVLKTIRGHPGQWTITDSHLSPDNERMIYSSITPTVYMTKTLDSEPTQVPIRFADTPRTNNRLWTTHFMDESFGIWSCRFSADGNEVVAGGNGKIFVYDLIADKRTVKIAAHDDDVNSCCWADSASGNVLISASDDTFLKVWDRRSLGASPKPSGVLIGHTEGITNVSAKGDGRYIISNGKDQALRLWDLRKMRSSAEYEAVEHRRFGISGFDYRYASYERARYKEHPQDCSVMTYRGHSVFRTLIRCHFSPAETTGGQYLYSGSSDGRIHIWSLDGRIVQVLDRAYTLPMSFDPSAPDPGEMTGRRGYPVCVRDVSWHSKEPVMMSAGWEGGHGRSSVARHEWKGLSKMGGRLEDLLERERAEGRERQHREERTPLRRSVRLSRRQIPGSFQVDNDEDDDEDDEEYEE